MPPNSLINAANASDAGGVAGRRGQKHQDHVAASFVIDMLSDPSMLQIECETADDVTIRWIIDDVAINEYVQVKTTDGDTKWSVKELTDRDKNRPGTSIAERSLNCDAHDEAPLFRLVTVREPRGNLAHFKIPRSNRADSADSMALATAPFLKKYPGFKSKNQRTLADWARCLLWQVEHSMDKLADRNKLELLKLAGRDGERPNFSEVEASYSALLSMVIDAGDASRVSEPAKKCIPRATAVRWWNQQIEVFAAETRRILKVYRVKTNEFFSAFHLKAEPSINRSLSAYDVEYDGGEWRYSELTDYLIDWIPEVALSPEILSTFDHLTAQTILPRAIAECASHGQLTSQTLLSELMLHAILRHHHKSEPIACKIFHMNAGTLAFSSAHVILDEDGDQLWLGQTQISKAADRDGLPSAIASALETAVDKDVLKRERKLILQLRHPQHLSDHNLGRSMAAHGKIDDLLSVLHVPILIAYDSAVLSTGFTADYIDHLRDEADEMYEAVKTGVSSEFRDFRIHIFLVPVECIDTLTRMFNDALRHNR
ncbi:Hachiman antiphage defense system protein HamA [uncultured Roseibium sp.]|uniref:HamA C-terminal domain-containing protein n=1 Tax=uncultured Roseibium sp. TaxID=1936171 RepID=UPI0032170988